MTQIHVHIIMNCMSKFDLCFCVYGNVTLCCRYSCHYLRIIICWNIICVIDLAHIWGFLFEQHKYMIILQSIIYCIFVVSMYLYHIGFYHFFYDFGIDHT
jgi:hypothetical protein